MKVIVDVIGIGWSKVTNKEALKVIPEGGVYWVEFGPIKYKDARFAGTLRLESLEPMHYKKGLLYEILISRHIKPIIPGNGTDDAQGN